MSWLLFMDESGHDHKQMPAEVRGGVAIHASRLWPFVQSWQKLERDVFGVKLSEYKKEIKGSRLLDRDRFRWADQMDKLSDPERRKGVQRFLTRSLQKQSLGRRDFTAYGQACIEMVYRILSLIKQNNGVVFASLIQRGSRPPMGFQYEHFLRKDHVFLLERYFYFLQEKGEHGLLVMDETEKSQDRRFVSHLQDYFAKTQPGRERTEWIVPMPLFVSSDMSVGVQAADIVLYCINWGFRRTTWGLDGEVRSEISQRFGAILNELQFRGFGKRDGNSFPTYGIVYVPDPYQSR